MEPPASFTGANRFSVLNGSVSVVRPSSVSNRQLYRASMEARRLGLPPPSSRSGIRLSSGRIPASRREQEKEISWLRNRTSIRRRSTAGLKPGSVSSSDSVYWERVERRPRSRKAPSRPKSCFGLYRDRITAACKGGGRSFKRMPVMAYAASVWNSVPDAYTQKSIPPDWFCSLHNLSRRGFLGTQTTGTKCSRLFRWYVRTNWVLRKFLPQANVPSHIVPPGALPLPAFRNRLPVRSICRMLRCSVRLLELLRF